MVALILGNSRSTNTDQSAGQSPIVGGLSLVERAVLAAQRAGVRRSVVVDARDADASIAARLRRRGVDVSFADWSAIHRLDFPDGVLLISNGVLVEPRALVKLLDSWRTEDVHGLLVAGGSAGDPDLAIVPASATAVLASPHETGCARGWC